MSGAERGSRRSNQRAKDLLAEAHREFREGLWARVDRLRTCLERMANGADAEAAEVFFRTAHSLKGTAPSFGAHELAGPARELTEMGRRWSVQGTGPSERELARAGVVLRRLDAAAHRFAESGRREDDG